MNSMEHAVCRPCLGSLTTGSVTLITTVRAERCCQCGVIVGAVVLLILNPLRLRCRGAHS